MDDALAAKLVRQHAVTARMLGADAIPSYGSFADAPIAESEPAPTPAPSKPAPAMIEPKPVRAAPAEPKPAPARSAATVSTPPAHRGDRARTTELLDALRARYEAEAPHKQFVTAFTNIVFGDGDPCAKLMFVGEAPGAEEDRTGRPFVGRAGELLNKMIVAMGLRREDVYIANVLKTRPPDNATPTSFEIGLCAPYLLEQIDIVAPEALVALGLPASRALLQSDETMSRMRGRWAEIRLPSGRAVPVMPTYHPAYVLRNYTDETRAKVWSDLQMVMERLGMKPAPSKQG